jgi:hypothetical protein
VRRWPAFQAVQGFFSPSAGNGLLPFAAVSVQDAMPSRPQVLGERGVASCYLGHLLKPPKGPSNQAPATAWRPLPQNA